MPRNQITLKTLRHIPPRSIHAAAAAGDCFQGWTWISAAPSNIREDQHALKAFLNLTGQGMSGKYLAEVLDRIANIASGQRKKGNPRAQRWALPSGLTRRQLNALPGRIESLAAQIERINAHKLLGPSGSHEIYLTTGLRRAAQMASRSTRLIPSPAEWSYSMSSLPSALKAYAAQLRWRIDEVSALRRGPAKGTESDFAVKREVLELVTRVRDVLGKYCWPQIVNLLRPIVAERAWILDADALGSFYRQNKKLLVL